MSRQWNYGCMFPGSLCRTWIETDGNIVMPNHSFISLLSSLALSSTHYKMSSTLADKLVVLNKLFGASYNILPKIKVKKNKNNDDNKLWQRKQMKNKFWVSKLYGCMFPGSLCCTQTETDGNILYLALLLLLGGDVTQFFWVVKHSYRLHSNFFFICLGVFLADDHAGMMYSSTSASMVFHSIAEVINQSLSKSCTLRPPPISLIIMHSYSSLCRWWCRKFIFFDLCTIICMCHLIPFIQT